MSGPTIGRSTGSVVPQPKLAEAPEAAESAENPSILEQALEGNETVGKVEDSVWTGVAALDHGASLLSTVAGAGNQARIAGAVTGAIAEVVHPTPQAAGEAVEHVADALGEHGAGFTGQLEHFLEHTAGGKVLDGALKGAAVADVAFNVYKDLNDKTFSTTGGKVANAAVDAGLTALMFTGPVGDAVMATELVTGGGVSGSAKGIVAMGEGMWTGDDSAVEKWTQGAKSGDYGWLVKAGANNETVSAVAGAVGSVAAAAVVTVAKPIADGVEALANTQAGKAVIGEVKREAAAVGDAAVALANTKAGKAVIGEVTRDAKVVGDVAVKAGHEIADAAVAVAHSAVGQEVGREAKAVGHAAVVAGTAIASAATAAANTKAGKAVIGAAKEAGHVIAEGASAIANSTVGKAFSSGSGEVGHAIQTGAHAVTAAMKELPKLEEKAIHAVGSAVSSAASAVSSVASSVSHAWNSLLSW